MKKQKKLTSCIVNVDNFITLSNNFYRQKEVNRRLFKQFINFFKTRNIEYSLSEISMTIIFSQYRVQFISYGYVKFSTTWGTFSISTPANSIDEIFKKMLLRGVLGKKYLEMLLDIDINNPPPLITEKMAQQMSRRGSPQDQLDQLDYLDFINRSEHSRARNIQGLNRYYNEIYGHQLLIELNIA